MTSVAPWAPTYDFENDEAPQNKVNSTALQTQLQLFAANQTALLTALALVIADDDTLVDQLVRIRNLHPELSAYLESAISGTVATNAVNYYYPVMAASTANVASLSAPQTIDGVSLIADDRVLLKDQTDPIENGLYVVKAGAWERATELADAADAGSGWGVIVRSGTENGETAWMIVAGGTTALVVGTDALTFMPIFAEFPVAISRGGTGATSVATAATSLGFPRKVTETITGDDVTTDFVVTHSFGIDGVMVTVHEAATGNEVWCDVIATTSTATVTFAAAPADAVEYNVTVIG